MCISNKPTWNRADTAVIDTKIESSCSHGGRGTTTSFWYGSLERELWTTYSEVGGGGGGLAGQHDDYLRAFSTKPLAVTALALSCVTTMR